MVKCKIDLSCDAVDWLTQDQRHENGQQKETTNPDNYETVLRFEPRFISKNTASLSRCQEAPSDAKGAYIKL